MNVSDLTCPLFQQIETQKTDFASRAEARTDSGVANATSPKSDQ